MKQRLKKFLSLAAASVLLMNLLAAEGASEPLRASAGAGAETYLTQAEVLGDALAQNEQGDDVPRYETALKAYKYERYTGKEIEIKAAEALDAEIEAEVVRKEGREAIELGLGETFQFNIETEKSGLYALRFRYLSDDESILPARFDFRLDGELPFKEAADVLLEALWKRNPEKSFDRYNKEITAIPFKAGVWQEKYLMDSAYRLGSPLLLELEAGSHQLTLSVKEASFFLESFILCAEPEVPSRSAKGRAPGRSLIALEAEDYTLSNSSSIHASTEYDRNVSPFAAGETRLNVIDALSFNRAGLSLTYGFEVSEGGAYYTALNYRQSDKVDFPVFADVKLNGRLTSRDFADYPLPYAPNFRLETLSRDGEKLRLELEAGYNEITFTLKDDVISRALNRIQEIMREINSIELEVTKVAGSNADRYRDLRIDRYIPGLESLLRGYAAELLALEQELLPYSGSDKRVAVMSSVTVGARLLENLADDIDEISFRMKELSSGASSVNSHLANALNNLLNDALGLDKIYLYQEEAELPGGAGFFEGLKMGIERFFASFTDQSYQAGGTNPEHLQVWVNRSNQHVQIMQKLIDESFTPETGIKVDISIMPDQYKLILANSAGNTPDVATGINYTVPYELAIRGALADLRTFEGFCEAAEPYADGFFLTATINDSIYALPETMNFWVQFYRTDIMDTLGLEVPETMDEVIAMLPELQMRGLNYYYPTAGMITMRNFHGTTPAIIQHGGSLYYERASQGTALGSAQSVDGFTALTELFTIYGMPVNVDNFYQRFRNGDLPIGIADYGVYNLMINAAPELANSWAISPAPGIRQEDGSINNAMCGNAESTVMFKKEDPEREQKAWTFMKWWASEEAQLAYGRLIQIMFGEEYLWHTANLDAFSRLPWRSEDKAVIIRAAEHVVDVARVPGTYMMEREMSNAFNNIAVDGAAAQSRIDEAVKTINREFSRKLEEFAYIDANGNELKPYVIPTVERVRKLLGRA